MIKNTLIMGFLSKESKIKIFRAIVSLGVFENLFKDQKIIEFIDSIWELHSLPSTDPRFKDLKGDIIQHIINNDDWDLDTLFIEKLSLLENDDIFQTFIEKIVDPAFYKTESELTTTVDVLNEHLNKENYELAIFSYTEKGLPKYLVTPIAGAKLSVDFPINTIPFFVDKNPTGYTNKISSHKKPTQYPAFILVADQWDDFGVKSSFDLFYYEDLDNPKHIGSVKIIHILEIEDYNGEDDNTFDFESWNVDFICSIAYSGSNPFVEIGNVEKRKEYWLWYAKMVGEVTQNPNIEHLLLSEYRSGSSSIDIPTRNQFDDTIEAQFKDILFYIMDCKSQKLKEGLEYNILFVSCVVDMFSITSSKGDIITLNTRNTDKICNAFRNIRELMYNKNSKQGAWFQVEMFLKSKAQYTLKFNYDNLEQIPSFFQKPDWLLEMFREYPRSKEYTPLWLRKIVGRRKLYLT